MSKKEEKDTKEKKEEEKKPEVKKTLEEVIFDGLLKNIIFAFFFVEPSKREKNTDDKAFHI